MHIRIILVVLMCMLVSDIFSQEPDSVKIVELENIVVTADSYKTAVNRNSSLTVEVADKDFLTGHFTGNLIQSLEYIPGVRSMDIGMGSSKPMIRGMGFNRITVTENGIKQEGQQWGSDHGLEIDAFNIDRVLVRKGPSSLLYGSDAMGGAIEIVQAPLPVDDQISGEVSLLTKTVNRTFGGSVMVGIKKNTFYTKFRYSEQQSGDYRIPADTIVYLTQKVPIYGKKLKNTAGVERNANLYTEYRKGRYRANYALSNTWQKTGFFPGAHGIPDVSAVQDDGDDRNIELPYSKVNHFKVSSRQQYSWEKFSTSWDVGFQNNHREEWSEFHTHYGTQLPPEKDPDKELEFRLNTFSSSFKLKTDELENREYTIGWDMQYQQNRIDGYSFLLPRYNRVATGISGIGSWQLFRNFLLSGGLRYDYGTIDISGYIDPHLSGYLDQMGYSKDEIEQYEWRSYPVDRNFNDFSGSIGFSWNIHGNHWLKANVGRSFRLPGANELASNGVHHGTFRHEQGDPALSSERGWQTDLSYSVQKSGISFSATSFWSWFQNYIYLKPTGEWSVLPHAGQIYQYAGAEAIFAGGEVSLDIDLNSVFTYSFTGEYVYTHNKDEHTPLSFSPPASMRNVFTWKTKRVQVYAELQSIASQNRVAKNESTTAGVHVINPGANLNLTLGKTQVDIYLSCKNLLDKKYYNHLSFYRKVSIPEPGRNFQLLIKIPFKSYLR